MKMWWRRTLPALSRGFCQSAAVKRNIRRVSSSQSSSATLGSTIFALSSGHGKCGVAVIRISGPSTSNALAALCKAKTSPIPRRATLKTLFDPATGEALDRGIALWFPSPSSFTGEDCAELQVHGSLAVVSALLSALGKLPGLRPAEPGEFTRRAFFSGKLDLSQVEGLGDLIHAETEQQRKQALRQMEGGLAEIQDGWRTELLRLCAYLEAYIDFDESEDIELGVLEEVREGVEKLEQEFRTHLDDVRVGERLRCGVRVAVVGEPNVGKSSLLNLLAGRDAAIVSPRAGTTRDAVETRLDLGGYPAVVVDTAGLRKDAAGSELDPVEAEGIRRAVRNADGADLVLFVLDSSQMAKGTLLDSGSIRAEATQKCLDFGLSKECLRNLMVFVNKTDLLSESVRREICAKEDVAVDRVSFLSCLSDSESRSALESLSSEVERLCRLSTGESPRLTRARHAAHLARAADHLRRYLEEAPGCADVAVSAQELRLAVREVGAIAGKVSSEQILDVVFADFCIGK